MPLITLKLDFELLVLKENAHAARMLTPGPMMSGFRILGLAKLGPLEEKEVTTRAEESPMTVASNTIAATGVFVELI